MWQSSTPRENTGPIFQNSRRFFCRTKREADMCLYVNLSIRSEQDLEERVVGLQLGQLVVVLRRALLESPLVLRPPERQPDQALARRRVEFLGSIEEDYIVGLGVNHQLNQYADIHWVLPQLQEEVEVSM